VCVGLHVSIDHLAAAACAMPRLVGPFQHIQPFMTPYVHLQVGDRSHHDTHVLHLHKSSRRIIRGKAVQEALHPDSRRCAKFSGLRQHHQ
jgi:hypothetical protein